MTKLEQAIAAKQAHFDSLVAQTITVAVELEELRQLCLSRSRKLFAALCDGDRDVEATAKTRMKAH